MDPRLEIVIRIWREIWFEHKTKRSEAAKKYLDLIEAMDDGGIFDALTPAILDNEPDDELTPCLVALLYAYCSRTVENFKDDAL